MERREDGLKIRVQHPDCLAHVHEGEDALAVELTAATLALLLEMFDIMI